MRSVHTWQPRKHPRTRRGQSADRTVGTVPSRDRSIHRARRRGVRTLQALGEELREARLSAGLRQADIARQLGASQSRISRIESAAAQDLRLLEAAEIASLLGFDLSARLFPAGPPLRDRAHVALLQRFRQRVSSEFRWRVEAPLPAAGDYRAVDVLLELGGERIGVEAEVRLRDLQAVVRRVQLKQRDGDFDRMILLVAASKSNRVAVDAAGELLQVVFPLAARQVLKSLRTGKLPATNGLVLL
jgi:transcriptional regulator with XRE-family HTH domain